MSTPTIRDIERAVCCPRGTCTSPGACYAEDRSRSYPVQIHEAAKAVAAMYCEAWRTYAVNTGPMVVKRVLQERDGG